MFKNRRVAPYTPEPQVQIAQRNQPVIAFTSSEPVSLNETLFLRMAETWRNDSTPGKQLYQNQMHINLERHGIKFLEYMAIVGMHRTIKDARPEDTNFFLIRLLYIAAQMGIYTRASKDAPIWHNFPLNPVCAFAFGKRVQINTHKRKYLSKWLERGYKHRLFKRLSSHNLTHNGTDMVEKIGKMQAFRSINQGLNLSIFGENKVSPFTGNLVTSQGGHAGHLCIVKKNVSRHSHAGSLLIGLENSQPLRTDQQGSNHGANCTPNAWSSLFLPKWNSEYFNKYTTPGMVLPGEKTNCMLIDMAVLSNSELDSLLNVSDQQVKDYVMRYVVGFRQVPNIY